MNEEDEFDENEEGEEYDDKDSMEDFIEDYDEFKNQCFFISF